MGELAAPAIWIAIAGGLGGLLNGIMSHNLFLWPARVPAGPNLRIVRPGLLLNAVAGAAVATGIYRAFSGDFTSGAASPSTAVSTGNLLLALLGALALGALAARWITNEADKRLLRAAVSKACTAPAAHPDTAATMELAPPYIVFTTANDLAPRFREFQ